MNGLIDLAIIGGGPAGTAAALEARRHGLEVLLVDRDFFPRDKVCGEVLSAEALPVLEQEIPSTTRRAAYIRSAEFVSRRGRTYAFPLPSPGSGLSRRLMDEALWQAAAASGVRVQEGKAVRGVRRTPEGSWVLDTGDKDPLESRFLIVACGRWWTLRGLPSPANSKTAQRSPALVKSGAWLGVKAHFRGLAMRSAVEVYFFPGGYCGVAPVEDGVYNACCLVHRSLVREACAHSPAGFATWMSRVGRHRALDERLRGGTQVSTTVTTAGMLFGKYATDRDNALLVGDAAGFIDPFTGAGISIALNSGRLAAGIVARARVRADGPLPQAEIQYRRELYKASGRSYTLARPLRLLVTASAEVQEAAARLVPRFGGWLTAETRWKA